MAEKRGTGSSNATRANAEAAQEGRKNPRTSSSAQAELGKKGRQDQDDVDVVTPT